MFPFNPCSFDCVSPQSGREKKSRKGVKTYLLSVLLFNLKVVSGILSHELHLDQHTDMGFD